MNKVEEFLSLAVVTVEQYEKMTDEEHEEHKKRRTELIKEMTDEEFEEVIKKVPNIYAKIEYTKERKELKNENN